MHKFLQFDYVTNKEIVEKSNLIVVNK